jgi:peptidoglycan-associated lipoprotein
MSWKRFLFFSLTPLLFASKCKDRKDTDEIIDVIHPDSKLQVIGIDPDTMETGVVFPAEITGSGFLEGASVMIGLDIILDSEWISGNQLGIVVPALAEGNYDIEVENPNGQKHTLQAGLWILDSSGDDETKLQCEDFTVYFDLDKSMMTAESQELVKTHQECLSRAGGRIRVEGHCDERGTTEYNIALGQRRANSVERYLVGSGAVPSAIDSVSYGEERPDVQGSGAEAWKQNRRAEIIFSQN